VQPQPTAQLGVLGLQAGIFRPQVRNFRLERSQSLQQGLFYFQQLLSYNNSLAHFTQNGEVVTNKQTSIFVLLPIDALLRHLQK
ncbi:MAG: hypothetical protein ACUVRJ_03705, partial [Candidatus Villigracilaceae bacterium]